MWNNLSNNAYTMMGDREDTYHIEKTYRTTSIRFNAHFSNKSTKQT